MREISVKFSKWKLLFLDLIKNDRCCAIRSHLTICCGSWGVSLMNIEETEFKVLTAQSDDLKTQM